MPVDLSDPTERWAIEMSGRMRTVGLTARDGCAWLVHRVCVGPRSLPAWAIDALPAATVPELTADDEQWLAAAAVSFLPAAANAEIGFGASELVLADALGLLYERLLSDADRKGSGSHFTPRRVADGLAGLALGESADLHDPPVVLDPSCGAGAFLLAAARHLKAQGHDPTKIWSALRGVDINEDAVAVASVSMALLWADWGAETLRAPAIECADFLTRPADATPADVVIGNPPFLTPLRNRTAQPRRFETGPLADSAALFGTYTDVAMLFLLASVRNTGSRSTVCLIQPQSTASSRDGEAIRNAIDGLGEIDRVWVDRSSVFSASTRVWCPVIAVGHPIRSRSTVRFFEGIDVEESPKHSVVVSAGRPNGRWGWFLARSSGIPEWKTPVGASADRVTALGRWARATAGFRDEFYGCANAAIDAAENANSGRATEGLDDPMYRIVTTGQIDPL